MSQASTVPPKPEALPLPSFLMKIYYIFPVVLYVPDAIFNFYVYSDGGGGANNSDLSSILFTVLWGFLAAGLVGMAWLCSVLAPWHWMRGNRFQSIMCWLGVIIATSITTWNSLAFRSRSFHAFITDTWISNAFHINVTGFSPTMVIVAVSPPFWGLFWAITQPTIAKKTASQEAEDHESKMLRMKQEAELKTARAAANAEIRAAQLKGLAATVRSARGQITGQEDTVAPDVATVIEEETIQPLLPAPSGDIPNYRRTPDYIADVTPQQPDGIEDVRSRIRKRKEATKTTTG